MPVRYSCSRLSAPKGSIFRHAGVDTSSHEIDRCALRALPCQRRDLCGGIRSVVSTSVGLTALLFGLGLIVSAQRPAQAAFFGFLFALAAFTIGLEWSVRSMHEFGRLPLVLAWVGEVPFAAVCALCWAAAAWVAIWLTPSRKALRWIALALTLTAAEWLRGAGDWTLAG